MRLFRLNLFVATALSGGLLVHKTVAQTNLVLSNNTPTRTLSLRAVSPIDYFRELLALSPQQRDVALAHKTPEQRKMLLLKLRQYDSMPKEERELRLRHTQLRFYLLGMMNLPPIARLNPLASIPLDFRPVVEERLKQWDQI